MEARDGSQWTSATSQFCEEHLCQGERWTGGKKEKEIRCDCVMVCYRKP